MISLSPTNSSIMQNNNNMKWWKTKSGFEISQGISASISALWNATQLRMNGYTVCERLYGNNLQGGLWGTNNTLPFLHQSQNRLSLNVVQSVVDTVTSKLSKNKPKPYFLTTDGNYRNRTKAKKLNRFVEGLFNEADIYDMGLQALKDACVWGDGIIHVFEQNGRVKFERVLPSELFIDEVEASFGKPRQIHRLKAVDRQVLIETFPKKEMEILAAPRATFDIGDSQYIADLVTVRESWHLPSAPDADDGLHVISLDNTLLAPARKWKHDFFPFARMRWSPSLTGFWSQSLADQIKPIQLEINQLLQLLQRSYRMMGSFKILMPAGSDIQTEHFNNDVGSVIKYNGDAPPTYITPTPINPDIYNHLSTLISRAYEQSGVSLLSAAGTKPVGVSSGKGLRTIEDIQSDRFVSVSSEYQRFFTDLGRLGIATAKQIAEKNKNHYPVKPRGRAEVDWKDVQVEDQNYELRCFSIPSQVDSPAARLMSIQENAQAGFLSPREAKRLLEYPDEAQVDTLAIAAEELILKILDSIVDEGEYTPPDDFMDLMLAQELGLQYLNEAKLNDMPAETVQMLLDFLTQVDALLPPAIPQPEQPVPLEQPLQAPDPAAQMQM